jgi:hypothetical protein
MSAILPFEPSRIESLTSRGRPCKRGGAQQRTSPPRSWGESRLMPEGRRCEPGRAVSRGRNSRGDAVKGRRSGRSSPVALGVGATQMSTNVKLAYSMCLRGSSPSWSGSEAAHCGGSTAGEAKRRARKLARRPQSLQPPGADPHDGWCGRALISNDRPPIPIEASSRRDAFGGSRQEIVESRLSPSAAAARAR